ncbi:hypothetical protein DL764_000007 [Monosporascus ibericus]|uniref:DUF1772 domain-containing protein n=1 Tax=Monosporascus ibericus TaxID=155417 RepID=A0A4Q4TXS0_9PEZI|nr:hypothetical protein DL764_000007 [Monosporascus ibericus]
MATTPGLSLLRVAPLLSSTASLSMTLCEEVYFRPFGTPAASLRPQANRLLRAHVKSFGVYSMAMTLSFYSLSIGTAIANLTVRDGGLELSKLSSSGGAGASPQSSRLAAGLYLAGAIFNALHFAFAPRDLALIEVVMDEGKVDADKGKDNCTAMAYWVSMNVVRGSVADLPGMVCSLLGFIAAMA